MWLHHIVEDLEKLLKTKKASMMPEISKSLRGIISLLIDPECVCVHAGDYSSFHTLENREQERIIDVTQTKFPFHKMLITYTLQDSGKGLTEGQIQSTRRAILIDKTLPERVIFLSFNYYDHIKSWWMDAYGSVFSLMDASESTLFMPLFSEELLPEKDRLMSQQDHVFEVAAALSVLDILSCKNVSLEKQEAPIALNKKRIKKGRAPIVSHYTLAVNVGKTPRKATGNGGHEAMGIVPLHLCRGHWKEYTAEAPLFGRAVGRFWFEPHMRGNKERGIRKKGYELKYPKASDEN